MFYKETAFQETAIGRIPKDWTMKYVKELFQVETGTTPSTTKKVDYWEKGTVNWLTPADMSKSDGAVYISSGERRITEKAVKDCNLTVMPKGSLVLSTRAPVGYVAVLSEESAFNQGCKGLMPREYEDVCPEFYYYYLLSKKQILNNLSSGSTFKELSKEMLEKVRVVFLKPREQKGIVEVLSCVDLAIQKTDKVIAKTEHLKKGLMQKLLTEGIGHKEFKDTKLGKLPISWDTVKLADLFEFLDNKRIPLREQERAKRRGVYPYYGAQGIIDWIDDFIFEGEHVLLAEDGANLRTKVLPLAYRVSGRFWVNNHAHVLRLKKDLPLDFFVYALNFFDISAYVVGSAQPKLNQGDAQKISLPFPSIAEQQRIAMILSTLDSRIELDRKQKASLNRFKQCLMDLLLTGKVRVKVD